MCEAPAGALIHTTAFNMHHNRCSHHYRVATENENYFFSLILLFSCTHKEKKGIDFSLSFSFIFFINLLNQMQEYLGIHHSQY